MTARFVARVANFEPRFKVKTLPLALTLLSAAMAMPAYALMAISESEMGDATAEGIAFLPENFAMQLNGVDDTAGTGYVRYIPVGPLTLESQDTNKDGVLTGGPGPTADHSVGKADIYLYGIAISQSAKDYGVARTLSGVTPDTNSRFDRPITSWGSAENPWLIQVKTQTDVPNFSATTPTDAGKGDVSFLTLEAPLYQADTDGNLLNGVNAGISGLSAAEKSAYNLKLGLWADAFVRDPRKRELEADGSHFHLGQYYGGASDAARANRLRLQVLWDGLSVNGSNLKVFQTLGGVKSGEVTQGLSTSYNHTFGISGVLRFNSGDGQTLRASYTDPNNPAGPMISSGANASRTLGAFVLSDTTAYGCGDASQGFSTTACEYRFRSRAVTDQFNTASTWKAPSISGVLRLSTQEAAGASDTEMLKTPAIAGARPTFNANDGVYLYSPNINLVLGNLFQPLTFGASGNNITMELARIPNKESIYKEIYTDYTGLDTSYKGSTCNIYRCGTSAVAGYQGSNATHSSITIGSTLYNSTNNTLEAYQGLSAVGISFGILQDNTMAAGAGTKNYTQWQDQQRQARERNFNWTDEYRVVRTGDPFNDAQKYDPYTGAQDCTNGFFGSNCTRTAQNNNTTQTLGSRNIFVRNGYHFDWVYRTSGDADAPGFFVPTTDALNTANGAFTNTQIATGNDTDNTARDYTNRAAQANNVSWTTRTAAAANQPNWIDSTTTSALVRGVTLQDIPTLGTINTSPSNNFGSGVIDGLLIQHMKFTTKGL